MLFHPTSPLHPHILTLFIQLFTPPTHAPPLRILPPRTNTNTTALKNDITQTITVPGIYICSQPNWTGICFTTYVPPSEYGQCGVITGGREADNGWWQSIGPDAGISVELYADRICAVPLMVSNAASIGTGMGSSDNITLAQEEAGQGKGQGKQMPLSLIWPGITNLNAIVGLAAGAGAGANSETATGISVDATVTTTEEKYLAVKVWPYTGKYTVGEGEGLLNS